MAPKVPTATLQSLEMDLRPPLIILESTHLNIIPVLTVYSVLCFPQIGEDGS